MPTTFGSDCKGLRVCQSGAITNRAASISSSLDVCQVGWVKVWHLGTPPPAGWLSRHRSLHKSNHFSDCAAVGCRTEEDQTMVTSLTDCVYHAMMRNDPASTAPITWGTKRIQIFCTNCVYCVSGLILLHTPQCHCYWSTKGMADFPASC